MYARKRNGARGGLRPEKVSIANAMKAVTPFPRSRLSKMHLHCDSRPRCRACCRCIASATRIAFETILPFVVVSKDETDATVTARDIELIKNCNYRAEIRKRALFRRWCKGHVNVIDRKSVIAESGPSATSSLRSGRETKSECMHDSGQHGKRALLLYPANRSVVLIVKSTRDARLIKARLYIPGLF